MPVAPLAIKASVKQTVLSVSPVLSCLPGAQESIAYRVYFQ